MEQRDYRAAVAALNSLQSNFAAVGSIRKAGRSLNKEAIPEMLEFYDRIGYNVKDFDRLRPIHIAGTKGKGSTSAFISSILAQYGPSPLRKIGLYTSPHLRFIRERIQINNEALSEEQFARYFFEVWDRLSATGDGSKPMYFRYLTLMAMHAFMCGGVDTAVVECGIGGEYDSTNVFVGPTVAAVTSLGLDHVGMLGGTIEEIAWHKAGVFKRGAAALTAPQPESAIKVLKKRAEEQGAELRIIELHPQIERGDVNLSLAADFQKTNASLAVAVAAAHLHAIGVADTLDPKSISQQDLPEKFIKGLQSAQLSGRCEIRLDNRYNISWHLDGGHTLDSIRLVGQWFAEEVRTAQRPPADDIGRAATPRILVFNQQASERNPVNLARALFITLESALASNRPFTHVVFTTNVTSKGSGYKPDLLALNTDSVNVQTLNIQHELASAWSEMDPDALVSVTATIEEAIESVRLAAQRVGPDTGKAARVMVLVTGSLHLVGGALEVLESGTLA